MGVLGYPKGSALELLDGILKLRHCTTSPLGLYPGLVMVVVKGSLFLLVFFLKPGGNLGKRVRLTKKTRPGISSHDIRDPGHPKPRRWKRLRRPSSEGEGVRLACLAIFFLDLGLRDFLLWGRLEPAFGGKQVQVFRAGQCSRKGLAH